MRRPGPRNEKGIVLDWLLKVGVWVAIVGLLLFEGGAIVVNRISLDSTASDMAVRLATDIGTGVAMRPDEILDKAELMAEEEGVKLLRAEVDEEGILHLKVKRTAKTLIVGKISAIKDWAVATAEARSDVT